MVNLFVYAILQEPIDIINGPAPGQFERLANSLGFKGAKADQVAAS